MSEQPVPVSDQDASSPPNQERQEPDQESDGARASQTDSSSDSDYSPSTEEETSGLFTLRDGTSTTQIILVQGIADREWMTRKRWDVWRPWLNSMGLEDDHTIHMYYYDLDSGYPTADDPDAAERYIFVALDIGGILVKKALTIASLKPSTYGHLDYRTCGLIFVSCPHRGSTIEWLEDYIGALLSLNSTFPSDCVEKIRVLAREVQATNWDFLETKCLIRSVVCNLVCQTVRTFGTRQEGEDSEDDGSDEDYDSDDDDSDDEESAQEPSESLSTNSDDDMPSDSISWLAWANFGIPFELTYETQVSYLEQIEGPADPSVKILSEEEFAEIKSTLEDAQNVEVGMDLHCLALSQAPPLYPPPRVTWNHPTYGLSDTIQDSEPYQQWLGQSGVAILHLYGTEHVSSITQQLGERLNGPGDADGNLPSDATIVFEFNRRDIRFNSVKALLSTIIATMISHFGHLSPMDFSNAMREIYSNAGWSLDDLYQVMMSMQVHEGPNKLVFVISRLDECDETWSWFIEKISSQGHRRRDRFPWIISSQGNEAMKSRLSDWPTIDLDEQLETQIDNSTAEDPFIPVTEPKGDTLSSPPTLFALRPLSQNEADILASLNNGVKVMGENVEGNEASTSASSANDTHGAMEAHASMARSCLQYLTDPVVQDIMRAYCDENLSLDHAPLLTDRGNLISYATLYWPVHYKLSGTNKPFQHAVEFLRNHQGRNVWAEVQYTMSNPGTRLDRGYLSSLPLAAMHGLDDLVTEWVHREKDTRFFHTDAALALSEAIASGHISTAQTLLAVVELDQRGLANAITAAAAVAHGGILNELVQRGSRIDGFQWPDRLLHRLAFLGLHETAGILLDQGMEVQAAGHFLNSSPLHLASAYGHIETLKVLLAARPALNHANEYAETPLDLAASTGNPEAIELLVDAGADIEHESDDGLTPLLMALTWGNLGNFEALLEKGADPNHGKDGQDDEPWQRKPLLYCAQFSLVEPMKLLLKHKVEVRYPPEKLSPLSLAVQNGDVEVAQILLENGADANEMPPQGDHLLLVRAVSVGNAAKSLALTKLLQDHGARIDERDNKYAMGATALSGAARTSNTEVVKFLIERGADVNYCPKGSFAPLYHACWQVQAENVRQLLKAGANVNEQQTPQDWAPIHACYDAPEIMRILLEHGADPNLPADRKSPLHLAVRYKQPDTVKALLHHRPKIDLELTVDPPPFVVDDDDYTALSIACALGNQKIVRQLVNAGANVNHQTQMGKRPLDICVETGAIEAAKVLLEYRVPIHYADDQGNTVLHHITSSTPKSLVKMLANGGVDARATNKKGVTPLRMAVLRANTAVVKYLLARDPNPSYFLGGAPSLVHLACSNHDLETLKLLKDSGADIQSIDSTPDSDGLLITSIEFWRKPNQQLVEYLVETCHVNINGRGGALEWPVNTACGFKHHTEVHYLLEHGADPNLEDKTKRRALHISSVYPGPALLDSLFSAEVQTKIDGHPPKDRMGRTPVHFAASSGDWDVFARVSELYDAEELNQPDADGWTPLFWALLTPQASTRIVEHLIKHGGDIWARVNTGKNEWSPLKLGRYMGADKEVLDLLSPSPPVKGKKRWDEEFHQSKPAQDRDLVCDSCLLGIYGIFYACQNCENYGLCFRCYSSRARFHVFHDGDEWVETGPEFEDDETTSDKAADGNGSTADDRDSKSESGSLDNYTYEESETILSADYTLDLSSDDADDADDDDDDDDDDDEDEDEDGDKKEEEDDDDSSFY
ncbi:ankyrin repeat-containing domain protein [Aspergillus varians]